MQVQSVCLPALPRAVLDEHPGAVVLDLEEDVAVEVGPHRHLRGTEFPEALGNVLQSEALEVVLHTLSKPEKTTTISIFLLQFFFFFFKFFFFFAIFFLFFSPSNGTNSIFLLQSEALEVVLHTLSKPEEKQQQSV